MNSKCDCDILNKRLCCLQTEESGRVTVKLFNTGSIIYYTKPFFISKNLKFKAEIIVTTVKIKGALLSSSYHDK
jgi:hypothetical protein